jgi:hypothetical protein
MPSDVVTIQPAEPTGPSVAIGSTASTEIPKVM